MKKILKLLFIFTYFYSFSQEKSTIPEKEKYKYEKTQIYRDSMPYNGMFEIDNMYDEYEIYHIYIDGILKSQFSKDPSDLLVLDTAERVTSTFKNGRIINGYEFFLFDKWSTVKKWNNGVLELFMINIGAGYYGNQFTFLKNSENITVKDLMNPEYKIEIKLENNKPITELFFKNKKVKGQQVIKFDVNNLPQSSRLMLLDKLGEKKCYAASTLPEDNLDPKDMLDDEIYLAIYASLESQNSNTIESEFSRLANYFSSEEMLKDLERNSDDNNLKSISIEGEIYTDKNGKISDGIIFYNKTMLYELYKNGKVVKKGITDLLKFQKIYSDHLNNRIKY